MENKKRIIEEVYQKGFDYEKEYSGCSQCTIAALQDFFPVDDQVLKVSSAFAGGLGGTVEGPCGALCGGAMVLSYFFGRDRANFDNIELMHEAEALTRRLQDRFKQEYGAWSCPEIQTRIMGRSFNLQDPEQRRLFEEAGGHEDKCTSVVGKAASWVAEMLLELNPDLLK